MKDSINNLLYGALGLIPGESLAFIHDESYQALVPLLSELSSQGRWDFRPVLIEHDGIQPLGPELTEIIVGEAHKVILFGLVHNIWHTPERKKAKYVLNKRLASIVTAPEDLGSGASATEIAPIAAVSRALFPLFRKGATFKVVTEGGSDFSAEIGTPFCEDGIFSNPGTGGDFPSGEVGFGPAVGSVQGQSFTI